MRRSRNSLDDASSLDEIGPAGVEELSFLGIGIPAPPNMDTAPGGGFLSVPELPPVSFPSLKESVVTGGPPNMDTPPIGGFFEGGGAVAGCCSFGGVTGISCFFTIGGADRGEESLLESLDEFVPD